MALPKPTVPKIGNGGLSPAAKERRRKEALPGSGVGRSRTSQGKNPPLTSASRSAGQAAAARKRGAK